MKTIYYNSDVARLCGKNAIIKAALINYIYNYHRSNQRKGAGSPALIKLDEFVYQYAYKDTSLWKRSFIHKILKDLEADQHITITRENNLPVYQVSVQIADLLTNQQSKVVSLDLGVACERGIYFAIVSRFISHVIDQSPNNEAYNLDVNDMSEINRISPAQIYRVVKQLVEEKILKKIKSPLKFRSRSLSLARI